MALQNDVSITRPRKVACLVLDGLELVETKRNVPEVFLIFNGCLFVVSEQLTYFIDF